MKQFVVILLLLVMVLVATFVLYRWQPKLGSSKDGFAKKVDWVLIEKVFEKCEVKSASQAHSLKVSVVLNDGTRLSAIEPKIDDIWKLVDEANERCGGSISFMTE